MNSHSPFTPVTGWCVAYGDVSRVREETAWRDDRFAVIGGRWEVSPDARFVIAGEIELTNSSDLLGEVESRGYSIEVPAAHLRLVATLWSIHGPRTPELLRGAYAFSLWDRDKQTLSLVRDRVGVRTLYYNTQGPVRYAGRRSEVTMRMSGEVDLVALREYLCCAFVPGERTMWQNLREVRPGTIVRLPDDERAVFWQVEERSTTGKLPLPVYSRRLRATLDQVVCDSLPAQQPVGVFLSGGLDSSCVTALAAQLHHEPVHTYSIHFGKDCPNELEFSALVAEHVGSKHHVIEITPEAMWDLLPETMAYLDDPIGDPLTVPNIILGREAKKSVDTILNGEGGDPCFGGPKNQPMLLNEIYNANAKGAAPTDIVESYLASFQKCATDLPRLLRREIWEQVHHEPSAFADAFDFRGSYLNNLMFINTRFKGADQILTKVDNLTRAVGLRARSPLFDDRLVEMSLEIPPEYKLEGAREKAVLKAAVADLLPERILERAKSGMMVPVQRWFREYWHRRAGALLVSRHARTKHFFNQDVIRDWLNYRGDIWGRYGVKLWLLVSLELWLQANTSC